MAQSSFSPGDLVKLSAGGPVMTIAKISGGIAKCVWFNEARGKFEDLLISETLLVRQSAFTKTS
jgi:uncharacterized protein YodC (DUF2158 family)